MKLTHIPGSIRYQCENTVYSFLTTGDVYSFESGPVMLNGFIGSKKEGSANNIWLRIYEEDPSGAKISHYPLLGIHSGSRLIQDSRCLKYQGEIRDISYEVTFIPSPSAWFWDVSLRTTGEARTIDLVCGQDVGIADKPSLLENELYAAQYLGHTVIMDKNGYHICSRQNLVQSTGYPYIHQGILNARAVQYSTDGLQFFGLSYKACQIPAALSKDLPSQTLQFENSYTALQSERFRLDGSRHTVFFSCFKDNHPKSVSSIEYMDEIRKIYRDFYPAGDGRPVPPVKIRSCFGEPFTSDQWGEEEISEMYPQRLQEEYHGGNLMSFFTPDYSHVVLQQKELLTERPHGNIITTAASPERINNRLITSTNYISGIFNAQTVIGNTTKHKLLSVSRGLMDLLKNSGQRIWIFLNGEYRLLKLPAAFEAGLNYSRWLYQLEDDILRVTSFAVKDDTKIITEVESLKGEAYDFIMTGQLVLGTHEFTSPILVEVPDSTEGTGSAKEAAAPGESAGTGSVLHFRPEPMDNSPYPGLHYDLYLPNTSYTWSDDRIFFEDNMPQNTGLLTLSVKGRSHFQIVIRGALEDDAVPTCEPADSTSERAKYLEYYDSFLNGFHLEKDGERRRDIEKLNLISRWYCHNALVHFAVPHGLEQSGGAAWGTRDVCQGPMELFMAVQKFPLAREVLLNIFSHQKAISGEWPQWFMFDRYTDCQEDCHGDVIFWPLKCIGDYIRHTGDTSILSETLPFIDTPKEQGKPLIDHVRLAIASIERRFLPDTHLISYGGGDWDDTLQPSDESMKKKLVSSWTQALAYQVLRLLSEILAGMEPELADHLSVLAGYIKEDFHKYLIVDGIIPGFVVRADSSPNNDFVPMLHPNDKKTGIHLRLLPLTRSILADIAGVNLAETNLRLIEKHLHFPDGVRLMDRPAAYHGGVSTLFKRAEQAANVGREISLQYTHAHIRYIETLCKANKPEAAWRALLEITPINLKDTVPNAALRQSNLYFSSSEGAFMNRYDYAENFEKLRDGSIEVKGGWRIYSSGPGLYMKRLICDLLGIHIVRDSLRLCPVLPASLDGLRLHYRCFGHEFTFHYHISRRNDDAQAGHSHSEHPSDRHVYVKQNGQTLPSVSCAGKYRDDGISIHKNCLDMNASEIHIYVPAVSESLPVPKAPASDLNIWPGEHDRLYRHNAGL